MAGTPPFLCHGIYYSTVVPLFHPSIGMSSVAHYCYLWITAILAHCCLLGYTKSMRSHQNLFTPEQVSKKLDVSIFTVYRYIKSGKLKAIKYSARNFRIDSKDLDDFLKRHKTK